MPRRSALLLLTMLGIAGLSQAVDAQYYYPPPSTQPTPAATVMPPSLPAPVYQPPVQPQQPQQVTPAETPAPTLPPLVPSITLGDQIFHLPVLAAGKGGSLMSCNTCHPDGRASSLGPNLIRIAGRRSFWRGRADTLDAAVAVCDKEHHGGKQLEPPYLKAISLYIRSLKPPPRPSPRPRRRLR